jgi:hypothetical protein
MVILMWFLKDQVTAPWTRFVLLRIGFPGGVK